MIYEEDPMRTTRAIYLLVCVTMVLSGTPAGETGDISGSTLSSLPGGGEGSRCIYPFLPRVEGSPEAIRMWLEATGRWRPTSEPGRTPPADPQVGDTWDWYIWDLTGMPVANIKPCTVRGMGANSYIVVDDEEWNVTIDQDDVDRIVTHFEDQSVGNFPTQGIWDLNTSHFGDPPNPLDGLDRVFLLYYKFNIAADGFFWSFDQFPDGTQPWASNEADVVYMATDNSNAGSDYMLGVAAHEFEHMIHYNHDANEDTWVNEGLAELAMWLFGNPDTISGFNTNPDNSLTEWGSVWADYIQTYLWTLYAYEQFGGQSMIWELVHNTANGMIGYLSTLTGQGYSVTMENIFGDWSVANYLDDLTVPEGQYGYAGDTLPPFVPFRTHNTYPESGTGNVQKWATDYIRLSNFGGTPIIDFNGDDGRDFRVFVMALDSGLPTIVLPLDLDGANDGYRVFTEANGYAEVILCVANVYRTASANYTYDVDAISNLIFADGFESGDLINW